MILLRHPLSLAFAAVALLLTFPAAPTAAEDLARFEEAGLRISLSQTAAKPSPSFRLEVKSVKPADFDIEGSPFLLESPTRLVLDVPGFKTKRTVIKPFKNPYATSVRLGVHPDKVRIVLDLVRPELPGYRVSTSAEGQALSVEIGYFGGEVSVLTPEGLVTRTAFSTGGTPEQAQPKAPIEAAETPPPPAYEPPAEPVEPAPPSPPPPPAPVAKNRLPAPAPEPAPREALDLPISQEKLDELIANEQNPDNTGRFPKAPEAGPSAAAEKPGFEPSTNAAEPPAEGNITGSDTDERIASLGSDKEPNTIPSARIVKGIYFKSEGIAPGESAPRAGQAANASVMILVDNLGEYSLSRAKVKPNVYQLVIKNAKLDGDFLTYPQFPPDGFAGFEVVSASQDGRDVVIKLYVDEDVTLSPYRVDNQVWIGKSE